MKKFAVGSILFIWAIIGLVLVTPIVGSHSIQWTAADLVRVFQVEQAANDQQTNDLEKKWKMFHILETGCKCSETVAKYLIERGPRMDVNEYVGIISEDNDQSWKEQLLKKGFQVQSLNRDQVEKIQGVPFLQIIDSHENSLYVGGYGQHFIRSFSDVSDLKVLAHLKEGAPIESFPIYGCATSAKYKSILDPFKLKSRHVTSEKL